MTQVTLAEEGIETLFGTRDEHLRRIEKAFDVRVSARGNQAQVEGEPDRSAVVEHLLSQLSALLERGYRFRSGDIDAAIRVLQESPQASLIDFFTDDGVLGVVRRRVQPRSLRQMLYLRAMDEHDMVISIGPAGTGKTYLAMAHGGRLSHRRRSESTGSSWRAPRSRPGRSSDSCRATCRKRSIRICVPLYDALYDMHRTSRSVDRHARTGHHRDCTAGVHARPYTQRQRSSVLDEAQNTTSASR